MSSNYGSYNHVYPISSSYIPNIISRNVLVSIEVGLELILIQRTLISFKKYENIPVSGKRIMTVDIANVYSTDFSIWYVHRELMVLWSFSIIIAHAFLLLIYFPFHCDNFKFIQKSEQEKPYSFCSCSGKYVVRCRWKKSRANDFS